MTTTVTCDFCGEEIKGNLKFNGATLSIYEGQYNKLLVWDVHMECVDRAVVAMMSAMKNAQKGKGK